MSVGKSKSEQYRYPNNPNLRLHRFQYQRQLSFGNKHDAVKLLDISPEILKRCRRDGRLTEGIHWARYNIRTVRYNLDLLQDWVANRANPKAHLRAIENYQVSLLSNQKRGRRDSLTPKQKPMGGED